MTSRWLKLLEAHVEKGVLGLAAVYMLAMLVFYLVRSPNTVKYQGEELGPRNLMVAIKTDADALEKTFRLDAGEPPQVADFSERLRKQHGEGIFASATQEGLALSPDLRLAATFGQPIVVPGLKESEEAAGSIALVTPLRPSQPRLRTGRSLAIRKQVEIAGLEEPAETTPPEESAEPVEVAWVSVAAYFNKKAQYNEMINAGYVPYRSKAYVAGVDVQRQEMLSNGEFSDWQDVGAGKAMPKFELPEPLFDDQTGELVNKDKIRQAFDSVKDAQPTLMQPPFYPVEDGDFWEVPPLAGFEEVEEGKEPEADESVVSRRPQRTPRPVRGRTRSQTGGIRSRSGSRGGEAGGVRSGGTGAGTARSDAQRKADARKQIRLDLREARKLLGQKEYNQALNLANRVIVDADATAGDRGRAEKIVKAAQRWLERQRARAEGAGVSAGRFAEGLRRAPRSADRGAPELITHPETGEPAVWFHDDTIEAGRTYRYRMRVKLWNRYVGRLRSMQNPEDAKRTVVAGEWSFASEPVTVTPSTYFFLSGSRPPYTAGVDVWKWREGSWIKKRFDVAVGEVIGGVRKVETHEYDEEGDEIKADVDFTTAAVVLDLRFDQPVMDRWPGKDGVFTYREKTSTVMVYLDPADGQVKQRALIFDRRDPKKKELEEQAW